MEANAIDIVEQDAPIAQTTRPPSNLLVVAEHPDELQASQEKLVGWFHAKMLACCAERDEIEADKQRAKAMKISTKSFTRMAGLAQKRVDFYHKAHAALQAGYCIVPNFPVDIIAIRVQEESAPVGSRVVPYGLGRGDFEQEAGFLPTGEGEYKSNLPEIGKWTEDRKQKDGAVDKFHHYTAKDFVDVEFPFHMVKPRVLEATQRAMALRCFDRIGVLPGRRRKVDPIVVGQVVDASDPKKQRLISFMVAWWIDTSVF